MCFTVLSTRGPRVVIVCRLCIVDRDVPARRDVTHITIARVTNLTERVITEPIRARSLGCSAGICLRTTHCSKFRIAVSSIASPRARPAADNGRENQQPLSILNRRRDGLLVIAIAILTEYIARFDARSAPVLKHIYPVVIVAVVDRATLAEGVAIDDAADIRVVVEVPVVSSTFTPRRTRIAEDRTTAANRADVPAHGNPQILTFARKQGNELRHAL